MLGTPSTQSNLDINAFGHSVDALNQSSTSIGQSDFSPQPFARSLIIIDPRTLSRECFAESLRAHKIPMNVTAYGSVQEWKSDARCVGAAAILMNVGGRRFTEAALVSEIEAMVAEIAPLPLVLLADSDDVQEIMGALDAGVRSYIPSNVGVDVCIEAIALAVVGGVFVPVTSLHAMHKLLRAETDKAKSLDSFFTERQIEVVRAIRRGKANKIIAYELHLRESTVKVHIRNIMKKLNATNRTEVAYKINELFPGRFPALDA
jgi:DNA-binding NarL/FixJ family response regulator